MIIPLTEKQNNAIQILTEHQYCDICIHNAENLKIAENILKEMDNNAKNGFKSENRIDDTKDNAKSAISIGHNDHTISSEGNCSYQNGIRSLDLKPFFDKSRSQMLLKSYLYDLDKLENTLTQEIIERIKIIDGALNV